MQIQELRNYVEQQKGRRISVNESIDRLDKRINDQNRSLHFHEQAREVIRTVGLATQQELEYNISSIATLALSSVFDDPYELRVSFVERRNKSEADIYLERNGNKIDPLEASGGGVVNVVSWALRIAAWSMGTPKTRNFICFDEPFNNVSATLMPRVGEMIKEVSERLSIQLLCVTHNEVLMETADRTFKTSIRKGISIVEEV